VQWYDPRLNSLATRVRIPLRASGTCDTVSGWVLSPLNLHNRANAPECQLSLPSRSSSAQHGQQAEASSPLVRAFCSSSHASPSSRAGPGHRADSDISRLMTDGQANVDSHSDSPLLSLQVYKTWELRVSRNHSHSQPKKKTFKTQFKNSICKLKYLVPLLERRSFFSDSKN
jgi:hypothetical protein